MKEENEFAITPEQVESLITLKTKMIMINNPHNPTGALIEPKMLRAILEIAKEHKIIVLSDEIYVRYIYEGTFESIGLERLHNLR